MIHASVCTVGLFPNFHISILSYLPEDLGTHSIYGLTSAELRRYIKKLPSNIFDKLPPEVLEKIGK